MCGPDKPRCTESISTPAMSSASSIAFLIDSTAASRLTTTPRRIPRDSATPRPTTSSPPPSSISPTTAVTFEVPTSSPTRYRSRRATRPPPLSLPLRARRALGAGPGRAGAPIDRPNVHARLEAEVDVIDRRNPFAQRRGELHVELQPPQELLVAHVDHGRIAAQNHRGIVRVAHVDLRDALAELGARLERRDQPRGKLHPLPVGRSRRAGFGQTVDDGKIELRVLWT